MGPQSTRRPAPTRRRASTPLLLAAPALTAALIGLAPLRAPARDPARPHPDADAPLDHAQPPRRAASWAERLAPIVVTSGSTRESASVRLYGSDGEIDPGARADFERIAAGDGPVHPLSVRVEQLVVRAAYHFGGAAILVVSAWRDHASRHGTGEAIDFKLKGVRAWRLAAYLRGLPRVGVGIYTHPRTQFVHLDVRDQSYYWLDASPPGVHWRERRLRDPRAAKRDAAWTPEMDLPGS